MKKLIAIMACAAALAGCLPPEMVLRHVDRAHVRLPDGSCRGYKIKNWRYFGNNDLISLETDTAVIRTHSANVILIKDKGAK